MTINAFLSAKTCLFRSYPCNTGPSDGSFMLGCDNCDRWYHGSCMKIDKETGKVRKREDGKVLKKGSYDEMIAARKRGEGTRVWQSPNSHVGQVLKK